MKKKNNFLKTTFILLFVVYIALFIAGKTGYYETNIRKDTLTTQKQIDKFEEDVANNEVLDTINYTPSKPDYSNTLTKAEVAISQRLGDIINNKKDNVWDFIKSLFLG